MSSLLERLLGEDVVRPDRDLVWGLVGEAATALYVAFGGVVRLQRRRYSFRWS